MTVVGENISKSADYFLGVFGNVLKSITVSNSSKHKDSVEQGISDDEFKKIVQELKKNGVYTNAGAREVMSKQNIQSSPTSSTISQNLDGGTKNLFEGKLSFLTEASQKVAEASKNPIYKRDSCQQQQYLRRVSVFEWRNMSQKWQSRDPFLLDDDDSEIVKGYNQNRNSVNSLDELRLSSIKNKSYHSFYNNEESGSFSSEQNSQPIMKGKFEGRPSRLFLVNIGENLDFDDNDIENNLPNKNVNNRISRSKSILISLEHTSLSDDDDENFSILEETSLKINEGTDENDRPFALRRLCSFEVDFPSSSFKSSYTENSAGRQERRRAIKVDEVLWSTGGIHKLEP